MTNNKITAFCVYAPGIDNPIGMLRDCNLSGSFEDDEIYYFTKDHLGSVREIVGLDGKIKQRQRYSAYGRTIKEKNDSELGRLIDQPYGFTSREHDEETGMYYYRARYYDPSVGRFVSEDPIGFEGGDVNLYRYVLSNPLRFTDPTGMNAWEDAKRNVRRCKKFINDTLKEGTCSAAKQVKKDYECAEWEDNLGEILNPRNWLPVDKKKSENSSS